MITVSKNEIAKRWDDLSQALRDALWSEYNADVLWDVCKKEHLNEDKAAIVATLAGDVMMGFLLLEDLSKEIAETTEINQEIAGRITAEIEKKIFKPVMEDIKEVYSPPTETTRNEVDSVIKVAEGTNKEEQGVALVQKVVGSKPPETKIRISKPSPPEKPAAARPKEEKRETPQEAEAKPFVLHQEEQQQSVAEGDDFKSIDLPFGFFGKEGKKTDSSGPVRVKVEAPGAEPKRPPRTSPTRGSGFFKGFSKKKDDGKRTVHYNEYRTPLTPFGKPEEDIINLQNITKEAPPKKAEQPTITTRPEAVKEEVPRAPEIKKSPAPTTKPPTPEKRVPKGAQKDSGGPSIEGNIIDLKNF